MGDLSEVSTHRLAWEWLFTLFSAVHTVQKLGPKFAHFCTMLQTQSAPPCGKVTTYPPLSLASGDNCALFPVPVPHHAFVIWLLISSAIAEVVSYLYVCFSLPAGVIFAPWPLWLADDDMPPWELQKNSQQFYWAASLSPSVHISSPEMRSGKQNKAFII